MRATCNSSLEVNTDVPNHFLEISRQRRGKNVSGGPTHVNGRSKRSKQKAGGRACSYLVSGIRARGHLHTRARLDTFDSCDPPSRYIVIFRYYAY